MPFHFPASRPREGPHDQIRAASQGQRARALATIGTPPVKRILA
jgi:hypothetical protein